MKKTICRMILIICMLVFAFNVGRIASLEPPATEWTRTYGGTSNDEAYCMIQTNDDGYALAGPASSFGTSFSIVWLVKTDANGNELWNKTYVKTAHCVASALVQTIDGGYALAGYIQSFDTGLKSFYLLRTDANGNMLWNKTYGGDEFHVANSLVETTDGGYALAGYTWYSTNVYEAFVVKTDKDGNQFWNMTYVVETGYSVIASIVQTGEGGYALAGYTGPTMGPGPAQNLDGFLIKTNADGNMQWNKIYARSGDDREFRMVQTADGGYALAGRTNSFGTGDYDSYLIKADANGVMEWNKTYGGTGNEWTLSVVQTIDGGYTLAGYTDSFGAGSYDLWLVRTDADGNMSWNKTYGGANDDRGSSVVETGDYGYVIAGETASFGAGGWDFWLIKLAPEAAVATVDVAPDTLNLKSNGQWVTAYIALPPEYSVTDIDSDTVKMDGIPAAWSEIQDNVFMAKFDRKLVQDLLTGLPDYNAGTKFQDLALIVTGKFFDGQCFKGSDTVRVITR
jgi:hypothetical protein